jgi:hypothetical protein
MPFALHTCGVTTGFTRYTDSYRTRMAHHCPIAHDPHALQEGRRLRSSRGRLARPAERPLEKALPAAGPPLFRTSELRPTPPHSRLRRRSRSSPRRRRLLSPARRAVTHTARPRSCSGPAPCRPCPGQEPAPGRVASIYGRVHDCQSCPLPTVDSFRLKASEKPAEKKLLLPPPAAFVLHRHSLCSKPDAPPPLARVVVSRLPLMEWPCRR